MKHVRARRLRTIAGLLAAGAGLALATPAAGEDRDDSGVEIARHDATRLGCRLRSALPPVSEPWLALSEEGGDPTRSGFVALYRFRALPSRMKGHALVVRLTGEDPDDRTHPGEKRSWALAWETRSGDMGYAYVLADASKPAVLFVYRARLRRIERSEFDPLVTAASPDLLLCSALVGVGDALETRILQRTLGAAAETRAALHAVNVGRHWQCR